MLTLRNIDLAILQLFDHRFKQRHHSTAFTNQKELATLTITTNFFSSNIPGITQINPTHRE